MMEVQGSSGLLWKPDKAAREAKAAQQKAAIIAEESTNFRISLKVPQAWEIRSQQDPSIWFINLFFQKKN